MASPAQCPTMHKFYICDGQTPLGVVFSAQRDRPAAVLTFLQSRYAPLSARTRDRLRAKLDYAIDTAAARAAGRLPVVFADQASAHEATADTPGGHSPAPGATAGATPADDAAIRHTMDAILL